MMAEIKKHSYPYWFSYAPYKNVFPRLFSWANFTADEKFFKDSYELLWRYFNYWYDKEKDDWVVVGNLLKNFLKVLAQ